MTPATIAALERSKSFRLSSSRLKHAHALQTIPTGPMDQRVPATPAAAPIPPDFNGGTASEVPTPFSSPTAASPTLQQSSIVLDMYRASHARVPSSVMDAGSNASDSTVLRRHSSIGASCTETDHVIDPLTITVDTSLGSGRYSSTLCGEWLERKCVVKKLKVLSSDDVNPEDVATFKLEAEQLLFVQFDFNSRQFVWIFSAYRTCLGLCSTLPPHPHLTTVFGVSQLGPQLCFVEEFIDGEPLQLVLRSGVPLRMKLRFIRQIASAMSYLHQHSIRFAKTFVPHNIMARFMIRVCVFESYLKGLFC
jgi:hypothetical protein